MVNKRPAVTLCCAMMGGIVLRAQLGDMFGPPIALISCGVFIFSHIVLSRFLPLYSRFEFIFIIVLIVMFGYARAVFDDNTLSSRNVGRFADTAKAAAVIGTLTDPPRRTQFGMKCTIEAESLVAGGAAASVEGGIIVTLGRDSTSVVSPDSFRFGDRVLAGGLLSPLPSPRNPGEFDARRYYELNDINARLLVPVSTGITRRDGGSPSFMRWAVVPVRRSIAAAVDRYFEGEEASFLKGLLIGERAEIPAEVKTSFINAGVMHILAVSGLHVAIVVMMLLACAQLLRIPRRAGIIVTIVVLVYYNYLTGGAASVTRSVIMGTVFLGGRLFELKSDMFNTLAVSAIIILLVDSRQLYQPGFQLSYAAVASLVYLYPKIYAWRSVLPGGIANNGVVRLLFASVSVSLAAGIGTLPFTAIYFEKISLIGFLANIVIVPLSNVILGLGMATVAISYVSDVIASCLAATVSLSTWLMLELVRRFGGAPFAFVESHFTVADALWYYYAVAALVHIRHRTFRAWNVMFVLLAANVCLYRTIWAPPGQYLRVTFIDVGQGDAALISFPDGSTMLVDGGPRSATLDAGARFIVPFLKRSGVGTIDRILVSHPHSDHIGGLLSVLRARPPGSVVDAGSRGDGWLFSEYERLVDSLGARHDTARAGMRLPAMSAVRVMCLAPRPGEVRSGQEQTANLNNESIVLKIVYGATSILLAGDAEEEIEQELIAEYGAFLGADVIKVGHHGSATSSSAAFIDLVAPRQGVISVGLNNKFHHPSPAVVARYIRSHCTIRRTDESGAIILESDGVAWREVPWH